MHDPKICHLCGKAAYGGVEGPGRTILPICLSHYMELAAVENERQRLAQDQARQTMAMLNYASQEMTAITGFASPMVQIPAAPTGQSFTSISVHDSTVGVINTAAVNQITASINAMPRQDPARDALAQFTAAVTENAALTDEGKKAFLDQLTVVSEQAATPPEKRKPAVLMPMLSAIAEGSKAITGLAEAWAHVEPIIKSHFGH